MADLEKQLSFLDVFCIASGAMISSGIFILPGVAFAMAGPLVFVSYLLAGVLALLGTLSIVELSTAMPRAGGDYYFVTRSFGPLMGTVSGLMSWMALCLKSAFAIFGIAEIVYLSTGIPVYPSSVVLVVLFTVLNMVGVKGATRLEVVLVLALFALMTVYIVSGMPRVEESRFSPLLPMGANAVLVTAGFVFVSFGGLLNIASISGEVKNPTRNIPLAMLSSVVVITTFYVLLLIVTVGVLPAERLTTSLTPIADAARSFLGGFGYYAISLAALLAFVTTANAGILSASRYPLALSADCLVPGFIGKIHPRWKTPVASLVLTGLVLALVLLFDLETLVKSGSVVILTMYIVTNAAVIVLKESRLPGYRPSFRVPFYPWIQVAVMLVFAFLIVDMGLVAVEISLVVTAVGFAVFFFYGKKRHGVEFALMHIIGRVIDRELTDATLETELRDIILSRDDLMADRFHMLIEKAPIIDLDESCDFNVFFTEIAERLAADAGMTADEMADLLKQRERESSTAITPFFAVPHVIIPGEKTFRMFIVRSRKGIRFSDENPRVNAIFVLAGTRDERAFHLRALAAIAQIVRHGRFEKQWLEAASENQLRDILLLADRTRFEAGK